MLSPADSIEWYNSGIVLYFVLGLDSYQLQNKLNELRALYWPTQAMVRARFTGDLEEFENIFINESLFDEPEECMYWVDTPEFFTWQDRARDQQRLDEILENLQQRGVNIVFTILLPNERAANPIRRHYKRFNISTQQSKNGWIELLRPLNQKDIDFHISQMAERYNIDIEFKAKRELRERFGRDITMIHNEVVKLSLAHQRIRPSDVRYSGDIQKWPSDTTLFRRTYELVRNFPSFYASTQALLLSGANEITLLAQISYTIRLLLNVYLLWRDDMGIKDIGETLGVKPLRICSAKPRCSRGCSSCTYRYHNVEEAIKFFETSEPDILYNVLSLIAQCDLEYKSGLIESHLAFEILLLRIAQAVRGVIWRG